jgi:putative transposase
MKDYRLRIGMRFVQQGREFIIEGPLPDDQLKIKDTFTDICSARTMTDLLEDLFAGRLELIGAGSEGKVLRDALAQRRVSDLTLLDDGDPLKAEALRRLHYVQAVFDERPRIRTRETLSPIIERVSEQIKDENPPSWTTLKRWSRIYERSGEDVRALVPAIKARGNRRAKYSGRVIGTFSAEDQQKAKEVAQIVDETIRVKYLRLERPSVTSVHESAVARIVSLNQGRAEADKLPLPHLSSIYTAVEQLDPYEVALGRFGKRYADEQFRARGEGPRPVRPLERVECDETKLDLMVIDTETRLPLGRPWLTTMIDVCTKMITGFYLSFHPPGYLSVMRCLLQAVRPKSYLKADYPQVERDWPAYGVPETVVVDNAEHFHGKNFVLACAQIGTRVEYAPPRTPQYKASIERWFGTQNRRLLHELPGTTFSNVLDRDEYDPQKHAVISIDACLELVHLWIVDIYHQTVHRGIRDIPYRRWVEKIREWSPNLPPRSADLRVLIGFNADRAISPSGIELFTLRYNSPELAALRLNMNKGEKAPLKYDPQDISVIYVYDRVEDRTIDVPALNQEYTRKLTIWQHHVIRKYARRIVQDCVDIEALCRAKEKIQQIVERERFLTGNMRGKQKIAHYLDLGQKISDCAPGEGETGGKISPDSASVGLVEEKEDAKEINPPADHLTGQTDFGSSRKPDGRKKPARNSVSSNESARARAPQIIAEGLPLDQPGWSADYSLPTGNASEEGPQ